MSYRISLTQVRVKPRPTHDPLRAAIQLLYRAYQYAAETECSIWQFAVEIEDLLHLGVNRSDLRWLVASGIALHAREVVEHSELSRQFRRAGPTSLRADSCFVLAEDGLRKLSDFFAEESLVLSTPVGHRPPPQLAETSSAVSRPPASTTHKSIVLPQWNPDRRELWLDDLLVKRFRGPANNQELIFRAFHEERWAQRIDDPIPPFPGRDSRRRLNDTIKGLNRHQINPLLTFTGDGTGRGVLWEYCEL